MIEPLLSLVLMRRSMEMRSSVADDVGIRYYFDLRVEIIG